MTLSRAARLAALLVASCGSFTPTEPPGAPDAQAPPDASIADGTPSSGGGDACLPSATYCTGFDVDDTNDLAAWAFKGGIAPTAGPSRSAPRSLEGAYTTGVDYPAAYRTFRAPRGARVVVQAWILLAGRVDGVVPLGVSLKNAGTSLYLELRGDRVALVQQLGAEYRTLTEIGVGPATGFVRASLDLSRDAAAPKTIAIRAAVGDAESIASVQATLAGELEVAVGIKFRPENNTAASVRVDDFSIVLD